MPRENAQRLIPVRAVDRHRLVCVARGEVVAEGREVHCPGGRQARILGRALADSAVPQTNGLVGRAGHDEAVGVVLADREHREAMALELDKGGHVRVAAALAAPTPVGTAAHGEAAAAAEYAAAHGGPIALRAQRAVGEEALPHAALLIREAGREPAL